MRQHYSNCCRCFRQRNFARLSSPLLFAFAIFQCQSVRAETRELDRDEVIKLARDRNPAVESARNEVRAEGLRISQEETLPNPKIGLMWQNMSSPLPFQSTGADPQSNAGLTFSQELPFPGKLALRGKLAGAEQELSAQRAIRIELGVVRQALEAFYSLSILEDSSEIIEASIRKLRQVQKVATARYSTGEGGQQELLQSRLEAEQLQLKQIEFKRAKDVAMINLRSLLDLPEELTIRPIGKLSLQPPPTLSASTDLARSVDFEEAKAQVAKAKLEHQIAKRNLYPDFEVTGYWGDSGGFSDMWQFSLMAKVPLFAARRERPAIGEAELRLASSLKAQHSTSNRFSSQLRTEIANAEAEYKSLLLNSSTIQKTAEASYEVSLTNYTVGKATLQEVLNGALGSLRAKLEYSEQLLRYQLRLLTIAELLGVDVGEMDIKKNEETR